nr:MAG TPA: hypothetical protein [Siphoviridae sp. ctngg6]
MSSVFYKKFQQFLENREKDSISLSVYVNYL